MRCHGRQISSFRELVQLRARLGEIGGSASTALASSVVGAGCGEACARGAKGADGFLPPGRRPNILSSYLPVVIHCGFEQFVELNCCGFDAHSRLTTSRLSVDALLDTATTARRGRGTQSSAEGTPIGRIYGQCVLPGDFEFQLCAPKFKTSATPLFKSAIVALRSDPRGTKATRSPRPLASRLPWS